LVAVLDSKVVGERLAAVDVEVVHDEVDRLRLRVAPDDEVDDLGKFCPERSGVGKVKCRPAFGSTAQKTLAVPQRLYSLSRLAISPGAAGTGGRTSACSDTGFSSKHTTGSQGFKGFS
jgi:hypothetical protein